MRLFQTLILLLFLSIGCSPSRYSDSCTEIINDTVIETYDIPEYNMEYHIPFPHRSLVAPRENLSNGIAMCIIDSVTEISVSFLGLPIAPRNYIDVKKIVKLISKQPDTRYSSDYSYNITETTFLDTCSWKFDISLQLINGADSISVKFYGYIFSDKAIVVTAPMTDFISYENVSTYLNGLKYKSETQ